MQYCGQALDVTLSDMYLLHSYVSLYNYNSIARTQDPERTLRAARTVQFFD